MRASERRQAIWETLCHRRQETAPKLAAEFGVSERTIWYDIEQLTLLSAQKYAMRARFTCFSDK